jgi:hypothetical protein
MRSRRAGGYEFEPLETDCCLFLVFGWVGSAWIEYPTCAFRCVSVSAHGNCSVGHIELQSSISRGSPSLCPSTLLYSTLLYSTLLYSTLLYSTLLYSTLLYSTYPELPNIFRIINILTISTRSLPSHHSLPFGFTSVHNPRTPTAHIPPRMSSRPDTNHARAHVRVRVTALRVRPPLLPALLINNIA